MTKNIALFIDGTGNAAHSDAATNVRLLFERAREASSADPDAQCQWYIDGVGTDAREHWRPSWQQEAKLARPRKRLLPWGVGKFAGSVAGFGTANRIKEAYAFLVAHYKPGDRVFLFGFSRGAFAARSLAGFLAEVGILLKANLDKVEAAYLAYSEGSPLDPRLRLLLPPRPSADERLPVHMIGVWDTVERLGVHRVLQVHRRMKTGFHRTAIPDFVSHVRHALALHETRSLFEPLLFDEPQRRDQTLQQVWFPGAHADVGGGYAMTDRALADVALEWMACEARRLGFLVDFRPATAMTTERQIHNSIAGKFFFAVPHVRGFLKQVQGASASTLSSHRIHATASRRLLHLDTVRYPLFRFDVAEAFEEADRLAFVMAVRLGYELGCSSVETEHCYIGRPDAAPDLSSTSAVATGLIAGPLCSIERQDLASVRTILERLAADPGTIGRHHPDHVRQSVLIAAALGANDLLRAVGDGIAALAIDLDTTTEATTLAEGLALLARLTEGLVLDRATYSLPWARVAETVANRLLLEQSLVREHAAKTVAEQRLGVLRRGRIKRLKL